MMEQSERIGAYSIGVNLILVGMKALLGFLSGSVALMADAIHSSADVISSATVFAGIKISKRTSRGFPYGLYKVENLVSLLSSVFIFIAGYKIVHTVFLEEPFVKTQYLPHAICGVILTMAITFIFSAYELRQGKKLGSPSLQADAQHIRTDAFSSSVVLASLVGAWFGLNLDKMAALLVVVLILKAGFTILVDAVRVLLDASIDFETMDRVKTIILKDPNVISINGLWGRNSGPFKFIEADIVTRARDLEKADAGSRKIEKEIREEVSKVDHILIHYAPQRKETTTSAVPLKGDKQAMAEHFGEAPYFYLFTIRVEDGSLLSESYLRNPFAEEVKGKGIKVSEWLLEQGVDTVYSPKGFEGKGPGYVFSDAGVDVIVTQEGLADIQNRVVKKEAAGGRS
ncbi:MAG: cation diffusion facilitator family transporter [Thermodesulfobacteriota bacterium]|nr:cation diffusion facilitator family transporter [Thermodesulfobacteriota bacterium]